MVLQSRYAAGTLGSYENLNFFGLVAVEIQTLDTNKA